MSDTAQMQNAVAAIAAEIQLCGLDREQTLRVLAITLGSAVAMFAAHAPADEFEALLAATVEKVRREARCAREDIRSGKVA